MLITDKSANVSIVDTLPLFIPITEEKVEEPTHPPRPARPSVLDFNRRPTTTSNVHLPPSLPPTSTPGPTTTIKEEVIQVTTTEATTTKRRTTRRPFIPPRIGPTRRPIVNKPSSKETKKPLQPSIPKPRPESPPSHRVRPPFTRPNRNRPRRPPFIPPRFRTTTRRIDIAKPTIGATTPIPPSTEATTKRRPFIPSRPSKPPSSPFLPPGLLLPKPIPSKLNDDVLNFVFQDRPPTHHEEVKNILTTSKRPPTRRPTTHLPTIPDFIKQQMPLGNDPILALGESVLPKNELYYFSMPN